VLPVFVKTVCRRASTVMMWVQSLHGISHNKVEDTKEEHLELFVTASDKLAGKAMKWICSKQ
jgi:beta-ureidopropionase / N-carbamoyl-L-amino-acid hydrolase